MNAIQFYNPSLSEIFDEGSNLGINRDYFSLAGSDWARADARAADEADLLEKHDNDPALVEDTRDEDFENGEEQDALYPLDIGVATST